MAVHTAATLAIHPLGSARPVSFAAEELARCLARMAPAELCVRIEPRDHYGPAEVDGLWLGVGADLADAALPAVADAVVCDAAAFDDAIAVDVCGGQGLIAGSNPRSVLIAVYRYLTALGCRWVRPGAEGEYLPQVDPREREVHLHESAAYRHRGICIEGAVSYENVAEMIDWAPKVGYNAYFFQFREAYTFFERWYTHRGNANLAPEPFTVEDARVFLRRSEAEIAKRGLLYHAVGHGWTCEPLGIPGLGWDEREYDVPPAAVQYLAEVNGQRALWGGIPLNTNLCYSNPEVRRLMVAAIADYLQEHRNVDILHFWLADGSNNQCECAHCRAARPSDWYVRTLNELDALLTARNLPTKIVFLIYVDLLWPPETERLANPERFILMFAPITRSYSQEFVVEGGPVALPSSATLPAYERNHLAFPANVAQNVAFLRAWQAQFPGDSFDFDYHLMWDHYCDPGYYSSAALLARDAQHLHAIGLNGYMSCQVQRAFFPTSLPMVALGQTLWDDSTDFDSLADDYCAHAFGPDGARVRAYLADLSQRFDPPYLRRERPMEDSAAAERYAAIPEAIEAFRPLIARNLELAEPCQAASWRYLHCHADYCVLLARTLAARASGDLAAAAERFQEWADFVWSNELALQPVFDPCIGVNVLRQRLGL